MSTYTYPTTYAFAPERFEFGLRVNVLVSASTLNGAVQTVEIPGSRWVAAVNYGRQGRDARGAVEGFWSRARGAVNRVSLFHMARPAPVGTMRGSPTMNTTAAQGATTLVITTTAFATLLAGDMIGVAGMLLQVAVDATATGGGVLTVEITPPLRAQATSGAAVAWDRPTSTFIVASREVIVPYEAEDGMEFSIDLVEVWV